MVIEKIFLAVFYICFCADNATRKSADIKPFSLCARVKSRLFNRVKHTFTS